MFVFVVCFNWGGGYFVVHFLFLYFCFCLFLCRLGRFVVWGVVGQVMVVLCLFYVGMSFVFYWGFGFLVLFIDGVVFWVFIYFLTGNLEINFDFSIFIHLFFSVFPFAVFFLALVFFGGGCFLSCFLFAWLFLYFILGFLFQLVSLVLFFVLFSRIILFFFLTFLCLMNSVHHVLQTLLHYLSYCSSLIFTLNY